jgi:pyruvate formate lyase activating enzyme
MHEAHQYRKEEGSKAQCSLCSHRCLIPEGKRGICGVRENQGGTLYATTFGKVSAEAIDPIEKKPLFHYRPGTLSYSLGSVGCNFRCEHCQNWQISHGSREVAGLTDLDPAEGVRRAVGHRCESISWTYNEPTIWHEYPLEMGALARKAGIGTVYVTNGFITPEALRELAPMLEAYRVDLKSFSEDFYRKVCGGHLQPVLDSAVIARELGMHVETVTLVIPGLNDSDSEMDSLIRWVIDHLGAGTPMHFTRFHPDYQMRDRPATPIARLEAIYRRARELGLLYPYLGNVFGSRYEHTWCPRCGELLIERSGYRIGIRGLAGHQCRSCGEEIPITGGAAGAEG